MPPGDVNCGRISRIRKAQDIADIPWKELARPLGMFASFLIDLEQTAARR